MKVNKKNPFKIHLEMQQSQVSADHSVFLANKDFDNPVRLTLDPYFRPTLSEKLEISSFFLLFCSFFTFLVMICPVVRS